MTPERRAEIEWMVNSITPGKWIAARGEEYDGLMLYPRRITGPMITSNYPPDEPEGRQADIDNGFIAASPSIVRELLADSDSWRERFDRLTAAVMLEDDEVRYRILRNGGEPMSESQQRSRAEQTIIEYLRHYAGLAEWREMQRRDNPRNPLIQDLWNQATHWSMEMLGIAIEAGISWAEARAIQDAAQDEFHRVHAEMGSPDYDDIVDMQALIDGGHHWMYGVYWGRQLAEARLNNAGWTLRGERYIAPDDDEE